VPSGRSGGWRPSRETRTFEKGEKTVMTNSTLYFQSGGLRGEPEVTLTPRADEQEGAEGAIG